MVPANKSSAHEATGLHSQVKLQQCDEIPKHRARPLCSETPYLNPCMVGMGVTRPTPPHPPRPSPTRSYHTPPDLNHHSLPYRLNLPCPVPPYPTCPTPPTPLPPHSSAHRHPPLRPTPRPLLTDDEDDDDDENSDQLPGLHAEAASGQPCGALPVRVRPVKVTVQTSAVCSEETTALVGEICRRMLQPVQSDVQDVRTGGETLCGGAVLAAWSGHWVWRSFFLKTENDVVEDHTQRLTGIVGRTTRTCSVPTNSAPNLQ